MGNGYFSQVFVTKLYSLLKFVLFEFVLYVVRIYVLLVGLICTWMIQGMGSVVDNWVIHETTEIYMAKV